MNTSDPHPASFRDPSGHVFREKNILYRQVNTSYASHYDLLMKSGLYETLTKQGLLIPHKEVSLPGTSGYKVLQPEVAPFISYPYEWCFSQLQDAALTTLKIQQIALEHGMILKDASAYNIQFVAGKPMLIDTLSFETYVENTPWIAYKQFCQHFLAPLALISLVDIHLGTLSQAHLDGIPLDLASKLLPRKSRFSLGLGSHIHLHARSQQRHAADGKSAPTPKLPKQQLLGVLHSLESTTRALRLPKQETEWKEYYDNTNYTPSARDNKHTIIANWIQKAKPKSVWDAGANDGTFSRLAANQGIFTLATDIDPFAVEYGYRQLKKNSDTTLVPLVVDLTNPSPSIGWENTERESFLNRLQVDLSFALALIHHLAISNNLPLTHIAQLFAAHSKALIIEFVPKEDSNTQLLLATREDIFPEYTEQGFEKAFGRFFKIKEKSSIKESSRTLYYLERV